MGNRRQAEPAAHRRFRGRLQREVQEARLIRIQIHRKALVIAMDAVSVPAEVSGWLPQPATSTALRRKLASSRSRGFSSPTAGRHPLRPPLSLNEVGHPHLGVFDLQAIGHGRCPCKTDLACYRMSPVCFVTHVPGCSIKGGWLGPTFELTPVPGVR